MSVADGELPADAVIVARLRQRDEAMFAALIGAWSPGMLRAARAFVADEHTAQDVVQETWLGVLRGIAKFEGRSSVRTWAYRILLNRARTRGARDARTIPVGSLTPTGADEGPTVAPRRFRGTDDPYPGHWRSDPPAWPSPEDRVVAGEIQRQLVGALARRLVIAYLDGALDANTERRFVEHLAECDGCDRYLEQIRRTVDALGHLPATALASEARDRLLTAFRDWDGG